MPRKDAGPDNAEQEPIRMLESVTPAVFCAACAVAATNTIKTARKEINFDRCRSVAIGSTLANWHYSAMRGNHSESYDSYMRNGGPPSVGCCGSLSLPNSVQRNTICVGQ